MELVPGNDLYPDKKGFTWELSKYDETGMGFKITFEHPKYISIETPDTLKITFEHTDAYLMPQDASKSRIPNGYKMVLKLPPQGDNVMSSVELKSAQQTGQTVVLTKMVISRVMKPVLSMVLGSIMVLQILAHLPLSDVTLPANVL